MPKLVFKGTVFSGTGKGKKYVDLPWFKSLVEGKLGFSPYSGTLNLHLTKEDTEKRVQLDTGEGIWVQPQTGYYSGTLFKAYIDSLECAVVIPLVPSYPNDVLEIIAPIYLRGHLKLVDGSLVTVSVNV